MVISPSLHDHDELLGVCAIAPRRVHLLCWATSVWHGTIEYVTSRPAADPHLQDLARLRRVRDRIDREYARPLDVEALARGGTCSVGHLSRQFRQAYGEPPYAYLMTRRIERAMALLRRGDLSVTDACSRSVAALSALSAASSPNWWGFHPASIGARPSSRRPECRPACPNKSPDRSGIEKRRPHNRN